MRAEDICKALEALEDACLTIKEDGECERCPMKSLCFEDTDVLAFLDLAYSEKVKEMLDKAESRESRPLTREEAEADYWDVRRNDPDYWD